MTVTDVLGILVMNTLSPACESAAIKGIQGGKGYPFSGQHARTSAFCRRPLLA